MEWAYASRQCGQVAWHECPEHTKDKSKSNAENFILWDEWVFHEVPFSAALALPDKSNIRVLLNMVSHANSIMTVFICVASYPALNWYLGTLFSGNAVMFMKRRTNLVYMVFCFEFLGLIAGQQTAINNWLASKISLSVFLSLSCMSMWFPCQAWHVH